MLMFVTNYYIIILLILSQDQTNYTYVNNKITDRLYHYHWQSTYIISIYFRMEQYVTIH